MAEVGVQSLADLADNKDSAELAANNKDSSAHNDHEGMEEEQRAAALGAL